MTFQEFIDKWNWRQLEVAGSANAKYQCVDLANGYIRDVLGLPIIEWTDAKDFGSKAGDKYDYIKNTITGFPAKGDIVIWNGSIGSGHGHIAVCISATANAFVSFDQNWSKPLFCTIENHNYNNVDGWLHPKSVVPVEETIVITKKLFEQIVTEGAAFKEFVKAGYFKPEDVKLKLDAAQAVIDGLNHDKDGLAKDLAASQTTINQLDQEINGLRQQVLSCQASLGHTIDETKVLVYLKALTFWQRIVLFAKT